MAERKDIENGSQAVDDFSAVVTFALLNQVDREGDFVASGAVGRQAVRVQPAGGLSAAPIGVAHTFETADEIRAALKFNPALPAAREWFLSIKNAFQNGLPQGWNFSFDPIESSFERRDGQRIRVLKSLQVIEISPGMIPRGEGIATLCINCGAGSIGKQHAAPEPAVEPVPAVSKACGCGKTGNGDAAQVLAELKVLRREVERLKSGSSRAVPRTRWDGYDDDAWPAARRFFVPVF